MRKIVIFLMLFLLVGCQNQSTSKEIKLYTNKPSHQILSNENTKSIKIALASVISPKESLSKYNLLLEFIGKQLNADIEIIQKQTYKEVNDMLQNGEVDFAFICSLAYVIGKTDQYILDVASPVVKGKSTYRSYTIVKSDSTLQSIHDLEGRKFAFTDPLSYSGRLSVLSSLHQEGKQAESFFSKIYYTYSQDYSVKAVSLGIVEGATVDSIIFDRLQMTNPNLTDQIKIIGYGEEAGTPPIVASVKTDQKLVEKFKGLILNMDGTKEGQKILNDLGVDQYSPIHYEDYEIIENALFLLGENL